MSVCVNLWDISISVMLEVRSVVSCGAGVVVVGGLFARGQEGTFRDDGSLVYFD